jgi:hypothetical protein
MRVCVSAALLLSCLSVASAGPGTKPASKAAGRSSVSAPIQSERNIGKAYYEQGKYVEAVGQFQKVVASGKALATDHLNLALAFLQSNKLDEALGELTTAKQMDPKLVAADYNLGILYKRELRYPDAQAALMRVIAADPNDPAAWFNLGTIYFAERKLDDALEAHQHVLSMGFGKGQNFYVASLFHTFTTLVRLKRDADAQKILKIHEKVRDKVPGISLQNPALEGGKYGAIMAPEAPAVEPSRRAMLEKVTFAEITGRLGLTLPARQHAADAQKEIKAADYSLDYARRNLIPLLGPSVATGDYDGDGRNDLYVVDPASTNHLLHNNGDGTFTDVTAKAGVAGPGSALSAVFADYNNCGRPSLFVAGLGGVRLYRNLGGGVFKDETDIAGLHPVPGELDTQAVLFDADNDGFLDLVVTAYTNLSHPPAKDAFRFPADFAGAQTRFYRNNGDGTFTEITSTSGLGSAKGRMRGGVFADFDNDGYTDLCLFRDDGHPLLYANLGEGRFVSRTSEAGPGFAKSVAYEVEAADLNHDGRFDLALWGPNGYKVLMNRGGWKFAPLASLPPVSTSAGFFGFRGMLVDANGDSFADLLALDSNGEWRLIVNQAGKFREGSISIPASAGTGAASLRPTWLRNPGELDLVGLSRSGQLLAFEKEDPASRWLQVRLYGYKSNTQGIGSVVEVKAGNYYSKAVVTESPLRIFAGDLGKVDVVRVTWPNAVVQNWIDVQTDKLIEVRESERLASSCPFLYVWNGQRYVFVTDVLGTAPLGELAPDGTRVKPFPDELVRIPGDLHAQNGQYVFQLTDELREVEYFDQVRLLAVDHPAAEEVYSSEIYASSPPPSSLFTVREKRFPVSAVDDQGHDVLPLLLKQDGRYPTDFGRSRILGMGDRHTLTLDLGNLPPASPVSLWLNGWVFWTDSNGARALASNKQLEMVSPYLQVPNAKGEWETVIPDMGLPSGTHRTMRVDLTGKFLTSDHRVRIVTNLCIYWDQIFFSLNDGEAPAPHNLPLVSADLHYRGFSTPLSDPQHVRPDMFDYENVLAVAPWNPMKGRYTRYGQVGGLLSRADDRLVVMATGDEITVRFDATRLPPLKPGWKRDFFLETHGWAKDGEPNTAFAWTVQPLPFRKMANYPPSRQDPAPSDEEYRQYLRQYLTRPSVSLIPPLAPAVGTE